MSSKAELSDEDRKLLEEELGAAKIEQQEENPESIPSEKKEDVKLQVPQDEQPIDNRNPYVIKLRDAFTDNQKEQNERGQKIVETQQFIVKKTDGLDEELKYHLLNRKQDIEVRNLQKKWFRIKALGDKIRATYLLPKIKDKDGNEIDNPDYKEFNIKDFVTVPLLKGLINGESTQDDVADIIDDLTDQIQQERFNSFTQAFFGLDEESINDYIYKDLTFIIDVAYSVYSTVPY